MALKLGKLVVEVEVRGVKVLGSTLSASESAKIDRECVKTVGKGAGARTISDQDEAECRKFCAMVESWVGATDIDGNELECSDSIKREVFEFDQNFALQVKAEIVVKTLEVLRQAEKN